jgi:hypothetical protein
VTKVLVAIVITVVVAIVEVDISKDGANKTVDDAVEIATDTDSAAAVTFSC